MFNHLHFLLPGKTLIARSGLTPQQLLLLRQQTLQHQQQQAAASLVSPTVTQVPQTQPAAKASKIIPSAIGTSIASMAPMTLPLQRFSNIVATSGATSAAATLRGLTGAAGRALQTEEVLALLKQQSLRMAASQQYNKTGTGAVQMQPRDAIAKIQLRPEGGVKTVKQQLSATAILQGDTAAKLISGTTSSPTDTMSQIKAQMIESSRVQAGTQKTQTLKLVPASISQGKPSAPSVKPSTPPVQQVTAAQFQQVLALQQAAAKMAAKPNTPQTSTPSSNPSEQPK